MNALVEKLVLNDPISQEQFEQMREDLASATGAKNIEFEMGSPEEEIGIEVFL